MVGSTEYLNSTAFLRMLFSSRIKLGWVLLYFPLPSSCRIYYIVALFTVGQDLTNLFLCIPEF